MTKKKKIVLASWLVIFVTATIVTFIQTSSFPNLSKENKGIIEFIILFIGSIIGAILLIIVDYSLPGVEWIKRKMRIGEKKAP